MKTVLSWFGIYEWLEATFWVAIGMWFKAWDETGKAEFQKMIATLERHGYQRVYPSPD